MRKVWRVAVGTLVVAIAGTAAVALTPLSGTARLLALRGSPIEQQSLQTVAPGEIADYSVRFRNTGLVTWQRGATDVVLAVKNDSVEFSGAGLAIDWLSANRIAATLEPTVGPGGIATFAFKVRAPATTGVYRIPVGLVADGVKWLSEDAVVVLASDHGFHSELVDQTQHPNLRPGEASTLTVRVANTGTRTWSRGVLKQQVNLGLDGDDKTASALSLGWPSADRVAIQNETEVAPGAVASFTFRVRAPAAPGMYPLRLRPVVDGVTWMETNVLSLISVGSPTRLSESTTVTSASSSKEPSFTMSVAADRSSAAPGQAVNMVASFTSDSATRAFVGVEVLAPMGGVISFGRWWEREYFEAGELRAFPVTWQIPATAMNGPYTVRLRAFGAGWKPLFGLNDVAATIVVAPAAPAPSPSPSAPAATATPPGATLAPSPTVAPPTATPAPAPSAAPSFESSVTAAPATLEVGNTVTINASLVSATTTTALVSVGIYPPGGALALSQQSFDSQSFVAGQQRSYPVSWTVPADAVAGTYRVSLGVFSPGWGTQYSWVDSAATFAVTVPVVPTPTAAPATPTPAPSASGAPAPTPTAAPTIAATPSPSPTATVAPSPSFTQTTTVSPTSVTAGGSISISTRITSATASTAIVSLYVYAPDGTTQLNQQWFENQTFAAGQERTYTVTWPVPSTAASGTYVVKVGVFPPGWAPRHYNWFDPVATFGVTAPAATATPAPPPSFTQSTSVSPTSVNAGAPVSITTTVTSATAATGIVSLYVFAPGGTTQLNQQYFENQTFAAGQQRTYTVSWAVPATAAAGTYVVKAGVFPPGWAPKHYSWFDPAGSFTVIGSSATPTPAPTAAPTAAPTPAPTAPPTQAPAPTSAPSFSGLHVQGNRLVNGSGQAVAMRGVNRMGMEYSCVQGKGLIDGPVTQASVDAMRSWGINVVRLPLNEHCWLGVEGSPSGEAYQQGVESYVNLLVANGIYVMLDLQWSAPAGQSANELDGMPNTSYSRSFWSSVANRFKNNPSVLFDLFNEPRPNRAVNDATDDAARRQWECWRDGGSACEATQDTSRPGGSLTGAQTVGMQALVDAVRGTGATNVIVLSGIQWANTIWSSSTRNILTYKPNDPAGQLVASVHVYDNTWCRDVACYDREIAPVVAQMPVVFGEFGHRGGDVTFLNTLMAWGDARGIGYMAWTWALGDSSGFSSLMLITNYNGTPNAYGQVLKSRLAALGLVP